MNDKIKNIISGYCPVMAYCEGKHYLEFCVEDLDAMIAEIKQAMIAEIKQAILNQLDDSDDAKSNDTNYL